MAHKTLILAVNPLEPTSWTRHEVEDIHDFLKERLGHWPKTARIYRGQVCEANDVTPRDHLSSYALRRMDAEQPYFAVVYPEDPVTAIIAVVAVVAIAAVAFLFPRMPNVGNQQPGSSNNSLSARTNEARINGRIPDIFGKVRAYPDLLTTPYTYYQNGVPVEVSYMCVGRGSYELEKARDGETPLSAIAGAAASFYGPGTSPNSGDDPQLTVGSPIAEPVMAVVKMNDVNGQTLRPPNSNNVRGDDNLRFVYPDVIERSGGDDFTDRFEPGDSVLVSNATYTASDGPTTLTVTKSMRFESGGTVRFQTYNPSTEFAAGDTVQLSSTSYSGPGDAAPVTLIWTPATFPAGHPTALDRVQMVKLVGADPTKFYRIYHCFFKDIGTRAQVAVYQSDDASDTNSVQVAAWIVGSGATNSGVMTVPLAAQGGSGITGEATVDFGDGTTSFAAYNGTYATSGLGTPTVQTGGGSGTVAVDLVGTYVVASVTSTTMVLTSPATVNPDWSRLADLANDRTEYETSVVSKEVAAVTLNLGGTFTVLSVSSTQLVLSNPVTTAPDWGTKLQSLPGSATPYLSPSISTTGVNWTGAFVVDVRDLDRVLANFLAPQGLYQINKKGKQRPNSVTVELELTPVDDDDVPTGAAETFQTTLTGDDVSKDSVGQSLWAMPTFTGRCSVRARRLTPTNLDFEGTWVDEVKWQEAYGMARVAETQFGDVTTVMTRTVATQGALSLKSRKFSVVATRKLPRREEDGSFSEELYPTLNVADMICAASLDPRIGGRELWELDVDGIYDTVAEVEDYFGTPEAVQFCHTFDQSDTSFEETVQGMAAAAFCTAFRQGSTISLRFEKPTEDSVLLLNHRNKEPGTETRTFSFGISEGYDGVSLDYVDPDDDAPVTKFAPQTDATAVKAKKVETIGIRSHLQAHFHAWRAWNKLRYQHEALEVNAEEEADATVLSERLLVADNTRSGVFDGEVVSQDGLVLELSQPLAMEEAEDYVIFLQLKDGTVQRIAVTPGEHEDEVVLAEAPGLPLVLDDESFARTTYVVATSEGSRAAAPFILTEKEPLEDGRYRLAAVNYDERYYQNDKDHIDGLV